MTLRPFLAAACLACALVPAVAAPLRLALSAEGPQDLLLDVAPERMAVQYVSHDRPVAEPDTDNEAERGVAQAVDAEAPSDMLQSLAPEPAVAHDASLQGWMPHDTEADATPLVSSRDAAADDSPPLVEGTTPEPVPAAAPPDARPTVLEETELAAERRRAQRLAVQWTVLPLVLLSLGLWWALGRHRRRRAEGTPAVSPSKTGRHGAHRHARRRA